MEQATWSVSVHPMNAGHYAISRKVNERREFAKTAPGVGAVPMIQNYYSRAEAQGAADAANTEQKRAAALALAEANRAHAKKLENMRAAGRFQTLLVMANMPLVRVGGNALRNLREDCFDAARAINGPKHSGIDATYDTAMMGGEPYAVWN